MGRRPTPQELTGLVDEACDRFEAQCRAGLLPHIEQYLEGFPKLGQPVLLRELLLVELAYRRRGGEMPRADEYLRRFPGFAESIEGVFERMSRETDTVSRAPGSSGTTDTITLPPSRPTSSSGPVASTERGLTSDGDGDGDAAGVQVRYFADYELDSFLGQGGMGVVYKARQISLDRPVALKMIRTSEFASGDDLRRFQNEAEVLASLDHPHIVPVYEFGIHQDQRYFSMKLVPGSSLDRRLGDYRDAPLAAAELAATISEAVHHAHERGILHRDLKPANILVDAEGQPHVTDFGLAKRVEGDNEMTQSGAIVGTPAYMSPEQATGRRGSITTATDVYGLGAILYTLLTGKAPFGGSSVVETLDAVRHNPPERPAKLNSRVSPDLEVICMKCLEKEPRRRYASAHALVEDLRHLLAGEPIVARPVGTMMRSWMWCKRNPALTLLAASLVLALLGGMTGIVLNWREAVHQRNVAQAESSEKERERKAAVAASKRSDAINHFLTVNLLGQADPKENAVSNRVTVLELLDRAAKEIETSFADEPDVEAAVRSTIGNTYRALGEYEKGERHIRRSLELKQSLLRPDHEEALDEMDSLASVIEDQHKFKEAEWLFREVLDMRIRTVGRRDPRTFHAMNNLGLVLCRDLSQLQEAEDLLKTSLEGRSKILSPSHEYILTSKHNMAQVLRLRGRPLEAEPYVRDAFNGMRSTLGLSSPRALSVLNLWASILQDIGRREDALPLFRQALEVRTRVLSRRHQHTLDSMNNLANLLEQMGKLDEAEVLLRESVAIGVPVLGEKSEIPLIARHILARVLSARGKLAEAETIFRNVEATSRATFGPNHRLVIAAMRNRASVLERAGRLQEAEDLCREALDEHRRLLGEENPTTLASATNLGEILELREQSVEAERLLHKTLDSMREQKAHPQLSQVLTALGLAIMHSGRALEAESLLREAITIGPGSLPAGPVQIALAESALGECLTALMRFTEAESLLTGAWTTIGARQTVSKAVRERALNRLINLYESWGKPDQAAAWCLRRLDLAFPT
jgi:tetratricopeptide (TPR) repeat protein/tRNA A-37 threonylcarbamoyl transferase component Bud32